MIVEIKRLVDDYLHDLVGMEEFTQVCKKIYSESIRMPDRSFDLDCLAIIPFIHEFAYWLDNNDELRNQAAYLHDILKGEIAYRYSVFVKLPSLETDNNLLCLLDKSNTNMELLEQHLLFANYIGSPKTIRDVIHNCIFDMISSMNFANLEENDFNYINCPDGMPCTQVKDKLFCLLSYYYGLKPFLLSINYLPNNGAVYTIV